MLNPPTTSTPYVAVGETAVISATITSDGSTLTPDTVTARISRPDELVDGLTLWDDGSHSDGLAGDGVYANSYTPFLDGRYVVTSQAEGTYAGQSYRRSSQTLLTVTPAGAALSGNYNDWVEDQNGDGRYDLLHIQAGIQAASAGSYRLSGALHTADGRLLGTASSQADMPAGSHQLTLTFDAAHILSGETNGPYLLTNLRLLEVTSGTWETDAAENAYWTAAYHVESFRPLTFNYLPLILRP